MERSLDGINYVSIGQVPAVNNAAGNTYQLNDNNPGSLSKYYYRLRIREYTGGDKFSSIIFIKGNSKSESFTIYPNPAKDQLFITSSSAITKIELLNVQGLVVYSNSRVNLADAVPLNTLPRGTYIIKAYTNAGVSSKKFVKN